MGFGSIFRSRSQQNQKQKAKPLKRTNTYQGGYPTNAAAATAFEIAKTKYEHRVDKIMTWEIQTQKRNQETCKARMDAVDRSLKEERKRLDRVLASEEQKAIQKWKRFEINDKQLKRQRELLQKRKETELASWAKWNQTQRATIQKEFFANVDNIGADAGANLRRVKDKMEAEKMRIASLYKQVDISHFDMITLIIEFLIHITAIQPSVLVRMRQTGVALSLAAGRKYENVADLLELSGKGRRRRAVQCGALPQLSKMPSLLDKLLGKAKQGDEHKSLEPRTRLHLPLLFHVVYTRHRCKMDFDIDDQGDMQSQQKDDHSVEASATESDNSITTESQQNGNSRKRKRPRKISCELCKARKVKCDRQEPACGWCAKNNRVCIYKERKKPGLRASYGVELEDKINRMEAMLHVLGRRVEDHIGSGDCMQITTVGSQPDSYQASSIAPVAGNHHQDTPTTQYSWPVSQYPQILPKQTDDRSTRAGGSNTSRDAASVDVPSLSPSRANIGLTYSDDLPPHDQLSNLVDLYFKHINTWSPILDRKATFDILLGSQSVSASNQILLHAIVAVTLRFSKDTHLTADARRKYYITSRQKVQLYALEHPSIQAMQALALITVDAFGTTNDLQSWNLLALLARNIIQLGLAVEKSVYLRSASDLRSIGHIGGFILPQPETWTEDEGRRRLFWLTYIIDRYATISCHFDFVVDEKETDRPLPCRYDLFSKNQPVETRWFKGPGSTDAIVDCPENLGSFSYHCEVLRILSQIQRFLQNPVDIESISDVNRWHDAYRELDSRLSTWLAHLPGEYGKISQLCHSDPGSRVSNWIMIHAAFVTSVIRLHSVAAYPTSRSGIFLPSFNAVQRCLAAVESLRAIAQDVIDGGMLDLLGPPFAFSLWTSGRLLLVQAATIDCSVDPVIQFLISTLESMGKFWEVAKNWAGILSRLVQEGRQAEDDARQNQSLSASKSYNSMRRTAHHLASLASRKPRSVLDPASTRFTSTNELEYLDVFDWFNYPRLQLERQNQYANPQVDANSYTGGMTSGIFTAPNPESDWLNSKQPYDFKPPYE